MAEKKNGKAGRIAVIAVIVLLAPVLFVNLTLIIKGSLHPQVPPDIFGIAPLVVTSGSMEGEQEGSFPQGALIFVQMLDTDERNGLQVGDVITFVSSEAYVTHRIIGINHGAGGEVLSFITQGDANPVSDGAIPAENVVGKCIGSIGGLGAFATFLQTPAGVLVFVGVPVLVFIAWDMLRITLYNRRVKAGEKQQLKAQEEEIERLRAMIRQQDAPEGECAPDAGADTRGGQGGADRGPCGD